MTQPLVQALGEAYRNAPRGNRSVAVHLFGIRHAAALDGRNLHDLARQAGLPASLGTELRKGVRLAAHVTLRAP